MLIKTGLLYFQQAVKDGSIRKAADRLQVASSAVNRQLLQLEAELGVELFERLPRGIRATAAGELLLSNVQEWSQDVDKLRQDIGRLKGGVRGTIHIAAAESITTEILPQAMAKLQVRYPGIDFNVISGDNYFVKSALLAKDADLVCAFDISGTNRTETVTSIKSPIGVIAHPDHVLAKRDSVSISDCLEHPIIAPTQSWLNHSILKDLIENPDVPLQIAARVERIGMLRNLVLSNLGIAFLSPIGLRQDIVDRKLAWIPFSKGVSFPTTISLLIPKGRILANYTRELVDLLKEELDSQSAELA
ncbi:MAG: LysR family transcriptional regulator [Pseudomonadota bacterium]|nr:LysR family transcriptional regulator [Pseudomonadota bacterium]